MFIFFQALCHKERECRKHNDDGNIINGKKNVAAFKVEEKELLLKDKVLPDPAGDKDVKAVKAGEGKENP